MSEAAHSEGWLDEVRSAYLYRVIAEVESGSPRAKLFLELAREAEGQAAIWAKNAGLASIPPFVPDLRTRIVASLVRRYGPRSMRGVLAAIKVRGLSVYSHTAPGHPSPTSVDEIGKRHRNVGGGGNLRAAVFGINDGLVSNLSLILGVAGASSNNSFILLSGIAGLLAGAFSMAAGEYVSVRSQREMYEHQIGLEQAELDEYPDEEAEELALIYAARGMDREDAHALATRTIADPRAEGALIAAVAVTGAALFGVGAAISLFTGRSAVRDGLRMLAIGGGAGAVTYLVGTLLGVSLS